MMPHEPLPVLLLSAAPAVISFCFVKCQARLHALSIVSISYTVAPILPSPCLIRRWVVVGIPSASVRSSLPLPVRLLVLRLGGIGTRGSHSLARPRLPLPCTIQSAPGSLEASIRLFTALRIQSHVHSHPFPCGLEPACAVANRRHRSSG